MARARLSSRRRLRSRSPVPVVLSIDCEPDPRIVDPSAPARLLRLRHRLRVPARVAGHGPKQVTGEAVHLNWFFRMDHQIERCYGSASALTERYPGVPRRDAHGRATASDSTRTPSGGASPTDPWYGGFYDSDWLLENLHIGSVRVQRHVWLRTRAVALRRRRAHERSRRRGRTRRRPLRPHARTGKTDTTALRHRRVRGRAATGLDQGPKGAIRSRSAGLPTPSRSGSRRDICMFPLTSGSRWLGRSVAGPRPSARHQHLSIPQPA